MRLFKKFSPLNDTGFQQAIDVVHVVLEQHAAHFKKSWGAYPLAWEGGTIGP
jgi:hypothetical protein